MNANHALVFDFNQERAARSANDSRPRISLGEALSRIERCSQWLAVRKLCILAFTGTTLHEPVIIVASHPNVWILFSGRAERTGYKQDGALRYEVWEGFDRINQVRVRWQEVMACA